MSRQPMTTSQRHPTPPRAPTSMIIALRPSGEVVLLLKDETGPRTPASPPGPTHTSRLERLLGETRVVLALWPEPVGESEPSAVGGFIASGAPENIPPIAYTVSNGPIVWLAPREYLVRTLLPHLDSVGLLSNQHRGVPRETIGRLPGRIVLAPARSKS